LTAPLAATISFMALLAISVTYSFPAASAATPNGVPMAEPTGAIRVMVTGLQSIATEVTFESPAVPVPLLTLQFKFGLAPIVIW